jgi:hypothetical protein
MGLIVERASLYGGIGRHLENPAPLLLEHGSLSVDRKTLSIG